VNFELYDINGVVRLNQEVDIKILGGWTRANPQKSIAIMPRKKHGDNQLRYDVFASTKPFNKYKDIQMRNSGNDFSYSMLRDGFMQSIVMKRFDIDYLAYEPAVCFMNGEYFGIQNLRERTNADYLFSNYGLEEDEVSIIEPGEIPKDPDFVAFSNFLKSNDLTNPSVYQQINEKMDVGEFINYNIAEIFFGNYDWPYNNVKLWKKKTENKWRWILFDTDFGYGLYNSSLYNFNTLTFALGENQENIIGGNTVHPEWSVIVLSKLVQNPTFLNKFIDRFAIHLSSTFKPARLDAILDSVSARISNEIIYHKAKFGSARNFSNDISVMKTFSANRSANMLNYISNRFLSSTGIQTIQVSANVSGASYKLNSENIQDASIQLKYFKNRTVALEANPVPAYKFKHWELTSGSANSTLIPMGSAWKYSDGSTVPATNWNASAYSDVSWKNGNAQFGYGGRGEVTTLSYGANSNNKYTTAYFRKTISISNLSTKSNFILTTYIDDGAVVYVNGTELGRANMPNGTIQFATLASSSNNGITNSFNVPQNLLKEGNNVIAVEVHQNSVSSSDLIFNLSLTCSETTNTQIVTTPVYSTTLTTDFSIRAIYEQEVFEDPDKGIDLVFNEIVASNNLSQDEFGETDDYIEIYNNGDKDVNIAGWFITDMPGNNTLVQIPATDLSKTNIPSKGRIVLWADDQANQGVLHLGFKLSKEGETLVLAKTNYLGAITVIDSVSFPYMEQNLSYSRVPDGSENWKIIGTTFNEINIDHTGIENPEIRLNVYPTQVLDNFTVINAADKMLNVIDLTGKVMMSHVCRHDKEIIQANQLQRGIYIVVIGDKNFKIIKM
ncbi:MAG TPA: CotH kinase family protein, partial [Paludibacter sp.]|nr:CotH kinase family protein [Paludibacter sp.]